MLAAGQGRVGKCFSRPSYLPFSNSSSFEVRLKYCGLGRYNPCQLLPEVCSLSRSKPAQERYLWVTDRLDMTLSLDWSVKPQHNRAILLSISMILTHGSPIIEHLNVAFVTSLLAPLYPFIPVNSAFYVTLKGNTIRQNRKKNKKKNNKQNKTKKKQKNRKTGNTKNLNSLLLPILQLQNILKLVGTWLDTRKKYIV